MPWNRKREREIVFQMLFASLFFGEEKTADLYHTLLEGVDEAQAKDSDYIKTAFCGARDYADRAKEKIASAAKGWKIERFSKATLAILLLALYEMDCMEEISEKVAINEAVELAKKFDDDAAPKFVNGILGAVARAS